MRSLLFVPANSARKLEKAATSGADALILDLEDSVAASAKPAARESAAHYLRHAPRGPGAPRLIVRVNALDTGLTDADLDAVVPCAPFAIMLPKACGGADVQHVSVKIAVREAESDIADGAVKILPIVTETAQAMFGLGSYRGSSQRLCALTWGAEDLAADLGAQTNRLPDGHYTPPFMLARNMMLMAAASAQVEPIDTIFANFRDSTTFERECRDALRDGFTGKMAIHPDQVAIINAVFSPAADDVARAQKIIAAFADRPDAGVLSMDGEMIDRPHLLKAQRVMSRSGG